MKLKGVRKVNHTAGHILTRKDGRAILTDHDGREIINLPDTWSDPDIMLMGNLICSFDTSVEQLLKCDNTH